MNSFLEITSNDNWFKKHPEKIAGEEYETTSFYFPIMVKGTKDDVLRVTGMNKNNDMKKLALAKAKAKALKVKLSLGQLGMVKPIKKLSDFKFWREIVEDTCDGKFCYKYVDLNWYKKSLSSLWGTTSKEELLKELKEIQKKSYKDYLKDLDKPPIPKRNLISILEYAKKFSKANKGKIYHKSKSGSVYVRINNPEHEYGGYKEKPHLEIRISDHWIMDRDSMNPKSRYDYEIVRKSFDDKDSTNLKELFDE